MTKIAMKISRGSAVAQTVLGGLMKRAVVANFLRCMPAKNYGN